MDIHRFPKRFGKYVLLDLLNSGGMAEVFLAKITGVESFQRLIAIKCIRPELAQNEQFANAVAPGQLGARKGGDLPELWVAQLVLFEIDLGVVLGP